MGSTTEAQQSAGETVQQERHRQVQRDISIPSPQPLLARLYVSMLRCRMVEERVAQLAAHGKLWSKRPSADGWGLEASLAGVAMRLPAKDVMAPSQLSFAAEVARGVPLESLFRRLRGVGPELVEESPSAALALARSGRKNVVVVAFFDAAEAGFAGWQKAVQEAGARKLPIFFVMENGARVQGAQTSARKKNGAGFGEAPVITVDGTDVVAVARVARESLRCARAGYGPTVMECKVGAALEALSSARGGKPILDPIRATEERLARQGLWSEGWKRQVRESLEREIDQGLAAAFSSQQSAFSRSGIDSKG